MKKDSIVNLSQIRTIDKKRLITPKLTRLSKATMREVDEALKNSLALRQDGEH
jgi:mRNA interferase MazF